jgi:hypothetical protein
MFSKIERIVTQLGPEVTMSSREYAAGAGPMIMNDPLPFSFRPDIPFRRVMRVSNGWLIGYIRNEPFGNIENRLIGYIGTKWEGSLWWTKPDGSAPVELLNRRAVAGFVRLSGRTLVLTGDYLGRGTTYEYSEKVGLHSVAEFAGDPMVYGIAPSDGLLIVTTQGVVRYTCRRGAQQLLDRNLEPLRPNSVAVAGDGSIYVGMSFLVLRLIPRGQQYEEQWLVPADCGSFSVAKDRNNCTCDEAMK